MSETPKQGRLIVLNDTETFPSGFSKREFVIETPGEYPQKLKFEIVKDRCSKLDGIPIGSILTVEYDIRGNEYNGKYYVNLQCWKFNVDERGAGGSQPAPKPATTAAGGSTSDAGEFDDGDDIDF
jgi:single-strand DNA-binding protein